MSISGIVEVLLFIVPGFVTLTVRGFFSGYKKRSTFEFLYQSIVISLIINLVLLISDANVVQIMKAPERKQLTQTMQLAALEIGIAVVVAIFMALLTKPLIRGKTIEGHTFWLLKKLKLTDRIDTQKVWESVCPDIGETQKVQIHLPGRILVEGMLEYISDDPYLREVTIKKPEIKNLETGEVLQSYSDNYRFYVILEETVGLVYRERAGDENESY